MCNFLISLKMKTVTITILVLCLGYCYGQEEGCISNYAEIEKALLNNPANQYQIASAYFPLKQEVIPMCVTSYYYIGINRSDVVKQNCPNLTESDGKFSGCSKWKWCSNTFYMVFDLGPLEAFSFNILLDVTSAVDLELPSVCNINKSVLYEYFLRITVSLYHYARNKGQLDNGVEFVGYAARFLSNSDLEKMTFVSKPGSIDALINNENYSIDLKTLHMVLLILGLIALPTYTTIFTLNAYLEYTKRAHHSTNGTRHLKLITSSFVIVCMLGIIAMITFQIVTLNVTADKTDQLFYLGPYIWLWILIVSNFIASLIMTKRTDKNDRLTKSDYFLIEFILLELFTLSMQLLSWHLVFVLYGFILAPLRAFLYSAVITITVICFIMLLAMVFRVITSVCIAIYQCIEMYNKRYYTRFNGRGITNTPLMLSLIMLLIYTCTYCIFILHIYISSSHQTVEELTKLIIPKVLLIMIFWLLYIMLSNPKKGGKYWLLPKMLINPKEIWNRIETTDQAAN